MAVSPQEHFRSGHSVRQLKFLLVTLGPYDAPDMYKRRPHPIWAIAVLVFLVGADCRAQYELKRGSINQLFVSALAVPGAG